MLLKALLSTLIVLIITLIVISAAIYKVLNEHKRNINDK